jgi:hypothetical protein
MKYLLILLLLLGCGGCATSLVKDTKEPVEFWEMVDQELQDTYLKTDKEHGCCWKWRYGAWTNEGKMRRKGVLKYCPECGKEVK